MKLIGDWIDLASERLGGVVLAANDEFFAPKENLLRVAKPVWFEDRFTDRGKWMDGWETRRRRTAGHDWCLIRLGLPGIVHGVIVDTSHFRGNYPETCSLEATAAEPGATVEELTGPGTSWQEILPETKLEGNAENSFRITAPSRFTHLRFHIYPDGGVARLRVHGEVVPDPAHLASDDGSVDLAALENGATVLGCSDMFFGP